MVRTIALISIAALLATNPAAAIEPVNPNLDPTARSVLDYLAAGYGSRVVAGYNVYPHTPDDYQQTGCRGAIRARDLQWFSLPEALADWNEERCLLTIHWHWFFNGESAWKGERAHPVDVGRMVTPGTPENTQALAELSVVADWLQDLEDAGAPILFRPLHEIDGGWFWWTDATPENTAALWRMIFDYLTHTRHLDNLIWIYSAGCGNRSLAERRRFYPGAAYVDISGIDIYNIDYRNEVQDYWDWWNLMQQVSPGKMLALSECEATPDPDKMQDGTTPAWLYSLPWYGPSSTASVAWGIHWMRHPFVVTLDELPPIGQGDVAPHLGILDPYDDGSARFVDAPPRIEVYARDRFGAVIQVEYYADDLLIGSLSAPPYVFTWHDAPSGCYDLTAVAVDDLGQRARSNRVRALVGMIDLAQDRPVLTSSQVSAPEQAVDADYYTPWSSSNSDPTPDDEWIRIDLGGVRTIDRVNLLWGWKIHARDLTIDVALDDPAIPVNWTTVHSASNLPYVTWKATHRLSFPPVLARHVRLHALRRAGYQTWAGYNLTAFEVPVTCRTLHLTVRPTLTDLSVLHQESGIERRLESGVVVFPGLDRAVPGSFLFFLPPQVGQ